MGQSEIEPDVMLQLELGIPARQARLVPVESAGRIDGYLAAYSACEGIDPYHEYFRYPDDSLKLALFDRNGKRSWTKDLGPGIVPGLWFCPVYTFDLDMDGKDEIYYVNNIDPLHPLSLRSLRLERLNAGTGELTGQWHWPRYGGTRQSLSLMFRNFIVGGYVRGEPVLITAQGTYESMFLQAWNANMSLRWEIRIPGDSPGARGSHMCAVFDMNGDGIDELMWGERCIELHEGRELFCADRESYRGHSDVVQPVWDAHSGRWYMYTIRENDPEASPRVALYDDCGQRVWGDIERGHMHYGWVARSGAGGGFVAMAAYSDAPLHADGSAGQQQFLYEALTGREIPAPLPIHDTKPVDFNGDGRHELVRSVPGRNESELLDLSGKRLAVLSGKLLHHSAPCKLLEFPGEQAVTMDEKGTLRIWGDRNAEDRPEAIRRYGQPFYKTNRKLSAVGYNDRILGGI